MEQKLLSSSIHEVAHMAGASVATVSRVFNGHPYVKKELADRILKAAGELNYRPNAHSRTLRMGKKQTIGVLRAPMMVADMLYSEVISNNLVQAITAEGYGVYFEFMSQTLDQTLAVPEVVSSKRVDGLIIIGHMGEEQLKQVGMWGLPVCLINNKYDDEGVYSSSLDDYSGSLEAVQYLAALGRRRIGFVHGNIEWPSTNGRYRGYMDSVKKLGLEFKPQYVVKVDDDQQNYQGGHLATEKLLRECPELEAIYYVNDWYAIGGICAIKTYGKRVPEDISVVGYDNSWMASQCIPALTTVSLEPEEICHKAAGTLVRAIENRPEIIVNSLVRPRLIVRESTVIR